jgi:GNAT superfamily N-acetyltransferase
VAVGSELSRLGGYPFEVRYSDGSLVRARAAADVAVDAYVYFSRLFAAVEPDIAVIVAGEADWPGNGPYGLPFFRDDAGEIRPGIVVMPAGGGDFWTGIGQDLGDALPRGFHPEESWTDVQQERYVQKRAAKEQRVREGKAHAALVFEGEDCVGWCQFGAPDEVPRIKSRAAYEKGRTASPDWRIACCYAGKGHRRQGVAAAALAGAVDLIAGLGGGTVERYPEPAGSVPAGFLYNGALSTYDKLGFTRDRKIGKHRWVVTRVVEPRP